MKTGQFTIQRLMILTVAVAILLWLARLGEATLFLIPLGGLWVGIGWATWRSNRGRTARPGVIIVIVSVAASLVTGYLCSEPLPLVGFALGWLTALVSTPILIGAGVAWLQAGLRSDEAMGWLSVALIALICLPLSMPATGWPMQIAFECLRPTMNRLADQVVAGRSIQFPVRVGIYTIEAANSDPHHPGNVALLVNTRLSGPSGFVRQVASCENIKPDLGIVPSDSHVYLGNGWAFWIED